MSEALKALESALAEEIRLEQQLLALGLKKREALVGLDIAQVDQITAQEQQLLAGLARAGERRMRRTMDAAAAIGAHESETSVSFVAEKAEEPFRAALRSQAAELRKVLRDVARINASNKALTEQSLGYVRKFFEILGGVNGDVTYSRRGLETRPELPKIMIDEVV